MFLGHYGLAFAAKRAAPRVSLGTLTLATQWLDELWPFLLLLGLEHATVPAGIPGAPADFVSYPISHSLAAVLGWGVLAGVLYFALRRRRWDAMVVGLLVVSHWFLDVPMHQPDLELWPGSDVLVGFGAWNSMPLTLVLDGGVFVAGLAIYLRSTVATNRIGSWGLWSMVLVLVAVYLGSMFGPPPESERALAISVLGIWLFPAWAYWVDRHRRLAVAQR